MDNKMLPNINDEFLSSMPKDMRNVVIISLALGFLFKAGSEFFDKATVFAKDGLPAYKEVFSEIVGICVNPLDAYTYSEPSVVDEVSAS